VESISARDRIILRQLAKHKLELHHTEANQRNLKDWMLHNTFKGERPMIHLELGGFWNEVYPQRLKCEGTLARSFEEQLWEGFINHELVGDDYPVTDYFYVQWRTWHTPFGIDVKVVNAVDEDGQDTLGFKIQHPIVDLKKDFYKLGPSYDACDKAGTVEYAGAAADAFGDILPVRIGTKALFSVPTRCVVYLMDMESMLTSMYDYPDLFHAMMKRYAEDMIAYFRFMESNNITCPTTGAEYLGQGSWCYTDELPSTGVVTSRQMWGFLDSQETVGISPSMFEEMVFPYYKMIAGQYGLLSYGCCEPVHTFWENCLSKLDNLRKISISPWCNEEYMGAALRGKRIVYHRKPSSNYLGIDKTLDEGAFREHIRKTLKAARGCTLEITQRDVYTIHNDEEKARRYVDIIREEIINHF